MTMLQRHSKSRSMRCEIPIGPRPIPEKKDEHEQSSMRPQDDHYSRSLSWSAPNLHDSKLVNVFLVMIMFPTSSSGVKSLAILKSLRISSGVFPLIMFATVLQPTSLRQLLGTWLREGPRISSQKGFDIKVVGSKNNLKEHLLVHGDELLVPFADISSSLAGLILTRLGVSGGEDLVSVLLAILQDLELANVKIATQ